MSPKLSPTESRLIEEVSALYESFGLRRLQALIIGLLMSQAEARSLGEIADLLGRSKGPVSIAARDLANKHLIRKVEGPAPRKDYYTVHRDFFLNAFAFNMATVRESRAVAQRFLSAATEDSAALVDGAAEHLRRMTTFYGLMERFLAEFAHTWQERGDSLRPDHIAATDIEVTPAVPPAAASDGATSDVNLSNSD
ncbi:MAG: winged helix DNA-binding protein [Bacteroidota bacterium]